MLTRSRTDMPVPGAARRQRVRYVPCPECNVHLTASDLQPDPALLRRIKRAEAASQREEEEEELDEGNRRSSKRRITLASEFDPEEDDAMEDQVGQASQMQIKQERAMSTFNHDGDDEE